MGLILEARGSLSFRVCSLWQSGDWLGRLLDDLAGHRSPVAGVGLLNHLLFFTFA